MNRLRAGWLSFRRIHLTALIADWRRTLLSVIGVAVGVTVVLGTVILKAELTRPFDAFGPSLTQAAAAGVVAVSPNVSDRLPMIPSTACASKWQGRRQSSRLSPP